MRRREFVGLMGSASHGRSRRWRRNRGGPIASVACYGIRAVEPPKMLGSTNCDAVVSLKAKTSRLNIAHMSSTSI